MASTNGGTDEQDPAQTSAADSMDATGTGTEDITATATTPTSDAPAAASPGHGSTSETGGAQHAGDSKDAAAVPSHGLGTAPLPQPDKLDGRSTRTGYVYDVRMRFHSNVHGDDDHPEDPRRIWRIYDALKSSGCTSRMVKIPSREATVDELKLVHTMEHIQTITGTSATGQVLNGVAIVRPPGHHAEPDEAGGFCLYNNVAVAARYLQKHHGLKKIFILDWDVHHGNGTQKAFLDDPDVVYCSIHRYEGGSFYPGDPVAAAHTAVGRGAGRGRNINIPWPCKGMGDSEYIYTFNKVIMPIVYEFSPDFILVSAGFDAAKGDHIGENLVTPAAYGHMTHMLKSLAGGKIILALEGGYNLDSIAVSGLACTKALLSDPIGTLMPIVPNDACVQTIHEVMEVQSRFWKSITPMYIDPMEDDVGSKTVVELAKVLGVYRTEFLYKQHQMLKLPLSNPSYEEEFLDNVHCTGEFCARTMGSSNIIRPDKSILVDTVAQYVDKIVKRGNELIDVVVPFHPATEEERGALKEKVTNLLADIWDNFVYMTGPTRRIVLLATGFGCQSMISFMNQRQKDVERYVSCVVVVPGGEEPLPMVTKRLSNWYRANSFVVVADNHPIWDRAGQKTDIRIGNVLRSAGKPVEKLSDSLLSLYHTMFDEIDRKLSTLPPLVAPAELLREPGSDSNSMDYSPALTDSSTGGDSSKFREAHVPNGSSNGASPSANDPQKHNTQVQQRLSQHSQQEQQLQQRARGHDYRPGSISSVTGVSPNGSPFATRPSSAYSLVDRPAVSSSQRPEPYPNTNGRPVSSSGTHNFDHRTSHHHGFEQQHPSYHDQPQHTYPPPSSSSAESGNRPEGYPHSSTKQSGPTGASASRPLGSSGPSTSSPAASTASSSFMHTSSNGAHPSYHQHQQHQQQQQGYSSRAHGQPSHGFSQHPSQTSQHQHQRRP
ncbi:Histone deacetylase hda1 [Mortierella alpina]|nr:Histone deacetylase hda1 [Mortierella alpina]